MVVRATRAPWRREEKASRSQLSWRCSRTLAISTQTSDRSGGSALISAGSAARAASTGPRSEADTSTAKEEVMLFLFTLIELSHHLGSPGYNVELGSGCGLGHVTCQMAPTHCHYNQRVTMTSQHWQATYLSDSEASVTDTIPLPNVSLVSVPCPSLSSSFSPSLASFLIEGDAGLASCAVSRSCCCSHNGLRVRGASR